MPELLGGWGSQSVHRDGDSRELATYWFVVPTLTLAGGF